jgi:hypothetical protein
MPWGGLVRANYGGNISIDNGSGFFTTTIPSTMYQLLDTQLNSNGIHRFKVSGVRYEAKRSQTSRFIYSEWQSGSVLIDNIDTGAVGVFKDSSYMPLYVFYVYRAAAKVLFKSSDLGKAMKLIYDNSAFVKSVVIEDCDLVDARTLDEFVLTETIAGSEGATAPRVELRNVRGYNRLANEIPDTTPARDHEFTDAGRGEILRSPNGSRYRITVSDAGQLVTTPL